MSKGSGNSRLAVAGSIGSKSSYLFIQEFVFDAKLELDRAQHNLVEGASPSLAAQVQRKSRAACHCMITTIQLFLYQVVAAATSDALMAAVHMGSWSKVYTNQLITRPSVEPLLLLLALQLALCTTSTQYCTWWRWHRCIAQAQLQPCFLFCAGFKCHPISSPPVAAANQQQQQQR